MDPEKVTLITQIAPFIATVGVAGVIGWVATTWMRIKNGYPLEGGWGQAVYPNKDRDELKRIADLTQENEKMRAELNSIKDRMANMERIIVDGNHSLVSEIEALRNLDMNEKVHANV